MPHALTIHFDEAAGELRAAHRCTVTVAGHAVSHERDIELGPDAHAALTAILDTNRAVIETETNALAVRHVAAVTNQEQAGVTPLKVAGTIGALGAGTAHQKE